MIIVKLMGGLGNQMFQYAAGKALACAKNQSLFLDISNYNELQEDISPRSFKLNCFNVNAEIIDKKEILRYTKKNNLLNRLINKFKPYYRKKIFIHPEFQFDPNFYNTINDVYLNGYWQSYLYFEKINETILKEFSLKEQYLGGIVPTLAIINNSESVSVHIRRGDYITSKVAAEVLGCLPYSYYDNAFQLIEKGIKDPHYFIFSDDIEWVKLNMKIRNSTVIDTNNELYDLILMSHCKHNVIANSSFSWWAAWLNRNTNKIVIAPKKWFNDTTINTNDLIPPAWIRL